MFLSNVEQQKHFLAVLVAKSFSPHLPIGDADCKKIVIFVTKDQNSLRRYAELFRMQTNLTVFEHGDAGLGQEWRHDASLDLIVIMEEIFQTLVRDRLIRPERVCLLILDRVEASIMMQDNHYIDVVGGLAEMSSFPILGLGSNICFEDVNSVLQKEIVKHFDSQLGLTCHTFGHLFSSSRSSHLDHCRISVRSYSHFCLVFDDQGERTLLWKIDRLCYDVIHQSRMRDLSAHSKCFVSFERIIALIQQIPVVYATLGEWCSVRVISFINEEIDETIEIIIQGSEFEELRLAMFSFRDCLNTIANVLLSLLPPHLR